MSRDAPALAKRRDADRRISGGIFVFVFAVILAGFSKNFYLRAWLGTRPLIPTAWLHGFIMSAWLILFAIQVLLVARRRIDLHRRVGRFAAALAVLVMVVGVLAVIVRARLAIPNASLTQYATLFAAFDGLSLMLSGILVACAVRWRARPAVHRRLMTMAMVALLPPAFGRVVAYVTHQQIEIIVLALMVLAVLLSVGVDSLRSAHVHRASWVPGIAIVLTNVVTYMAQLAA